MPLEVVDVCDDDGVSGESLIGKAGATPAFLICAHHSLPRFQPVPTWHAILSHVYFPVAKRVHSHLRFHAFVPCGRFHAA